MKRILVCIFVINLMFALNLSVKAEDYIENTEIDFSQKVSGEIAADDFPDILFTKDMGIDSGLSTEYFSIQSDSTGRYLKCSPPAEVCRAMFWNYPDDAVNERFSLEMKVKIEDGKDAYQIYCSVIPKDCSSWYTAQYNGLSISRFLTDQYGYRTLHCELSKESDGWYINSYDANNNYKLMETKKIYAYDKKGDQLPDPENIEIQSIMLAKAYSYNEKRMSEFCIKSIKYSLGDFKKKNLIDNCVSLSFSNSIDLNSLSNIQPEDENGNIIKADITYNYDSYETYVHFDETLNNVSYINLNGVAYKTGTQLNNKIRVDNNSGIYIKNLDFYDEKGNIITQYGIKGAEEVIAKLSVKCIDETQCIVIAMAGHTDNKESDINYCTNPIENEYRLRINNEECDKVKLFIWDINGKPLRGSICLPREYPEINYDFDRHSYLQIDMGNYAYPADKYTNENITVDKNNVSDIYYFPADNSVRCILENDKPVNTGTVSIDNTDIRLSKSNSVFKTEYEYEPENVSLKRAYFRPCGDNTAMLYLEVYNPTEENSPVSAKITLTNRDFTISGIVNSNDTVTLSCKVSLNEEITLSLN